MTNRWAPTSFGTYPVQQKPERTRVLVLALFGVFLVLLVSSLVLLAGSSLHFFWGVRRSGALLVLPLPVWGGLPVRLRGGLRAVRAHRGIGLQSRGPRAPVGPSPN